MKVFANVQEFAAAADSHLGYSAWHEITQEQVNLFAEATGDHQWIHTDAERAARGPFGAPIAHGYLTLSLAPVLSREVYRLEGAAMVVNYGADRVRFPAPVPVGSRIRGGVELLSADPGTLGYTVRARVTVEIEGGTKPACVVDTVSIVVP